MESHSDGLYIYKLGKELNNDVCDECKDYEYSSFNSEWKCSSCGEGKEVNSNKNGCNICDAGKYSNEDTNWKCESCLIGTY
jgi:hypothetical protein